jgi:multiple sugar transport system substrate-binding protein
VGKARTFKPALENARPRPISPYYSDMSLVMAEYFNEDLKGSTPVEQAFRDTQGELQNKVEQT